MKFNKAIIGLMMFFTYSASANISITLMSCSIIGVVFLATGNSAFHTFFILMMITMAPYSIITSIAGGYVSKYSSKWESFQVAMPVKREDVIFSQYLCIIITSIIGIPFIAIITGITIALHESILEVVDRVIASTVVISSMSIGIVMLLGALFLPLTCMKISKNKGESLAFVCLFVSIGLIALVSWVGFTMKLSQYASSLLYIIVSIIPFTLSYFITKKLYAKLDL